MPTGMDKQHGIDVSLCCGKVTSVFPRTQFDILGLELERKDSVEKEKVTLLV